MIYNNWRDITDARVLYACDAQKKLKPVRGALLNIMGEQDFYQILPNGDIGRRYNADAMIYADTKNELA